MDPWDQFPDAKITGPRAADMWDQFPDADPTFDVNGTDQEVRARVRALPQEQQAPALKEWANSRVAKTGVNDGATRMFNKGIPIIGGFMDELGAAVQSGISSDVDYDEALALERAKTSKASDDYGWGGTALSVAGGLAAAPFTPVARVFQGGRGVLNAIGNAAVTGAGYAGAAGFAEGEGGLSNRLENAKDYGKAGAVAGGVLGGAGQAVANRYAPTAANALIRDADQIGVQIPYFMSGGRAERNIASKAGAIPFVGDDINAAVANTRVQAGDAAERMAESVAGPGILAREAGETLRNGLEKWSKTGARDIQNAAYDGVTKAMGNVVAPLNNTRQAVGELMRQQTAAKAPMHASAVKAVEEAVTAPNGLSFEGIQRLRTHVGTMMENTIDPNNRTAQAGLKAIYAGLSKDMESAIAQNGGRPVLAAWRHANKVTQRVAEQRDTIAKLIGQDAAKTGEGILERVVAMASTKGSADLSRLTQIRRLVGDDEWKQIAGNATVRLGRNQSNEFSPDIFLKNYTQLSGRGRQILFDSFGNGKLVDDLTALASVSEALQRFSRLGNPSGTGGVAALLGALTAAASGDMGATLATAIGGRGIGMLISRPAVVRATTAHARNMHRVLSGQAAQGVLAATAANLARVTARETGEDERAVLERINAASR